MKNKVIRLFFISGMGLLLLFSYQNCGSDFGGFGSLQKYTYRSAFPFPVKAEADYFGFMSCSGLDSPSPDPDFFTFRISSDSYNSKGGIGLSSSFLDAVLAEEIKRPATFQIKEEIQAALLESTKLADAKVQMSILEKSYLTSGAISDRLTYSHVYDSIALDSPSMIESLSFKSDGSTLLGKDFKTNIDLRLYSMSAFADIVSVMASKYVLGLNFTSDKGDYGKYLRSPRDYDEDNGGIYGRLFEMGYSQNSITYLNELDAEIGAKGHERIEDKAWNCSSITIVKPNAQDALNSGCLNPNENFISISSNLNVNDAKQRALIAILGDSWLSNSAKTCVIHKSYNTSSIKRGCYGSEYANTTVNYGPYDSNLVDNGTLMNAHKLTVCWVE